MIQIVSGDPGLPRFVRRKAFEMEPLVGVHPGLAWERLEELRKRVLPDLALVAPKTDYARCVSVDVFWRFHLTRARRELFNHPSNYLRYLESTSDPAGTASHQDLPLAALGRLEWRP